MKRALPVVAEVISAFFMLFMAWALSSPLEGILSFARAAGPVQATIAQGVIWAIKFGFVIMAVVFAWTALKTRKSA